MQVDMEQMVGNIAQMIGIEATNTVVDPLADMLGGNYVVIK